MSRPKPTIILSYTDPKTFKIEQVLEATAIYAVFYDGQPINLRSSHSFINIDHKYKKVSFSNSGHAFNLCEKLNKAYKTDNFQVMMLISGKVIEEKLPNESDS